MTDSISTELCVDTSSCYLCASCFLSRGSSASFFPGLTSLRLGCLSSLWHRIFYLVSWCLGFCLLEIASSVEDWFLAYLPWLSRCPVVWAWPSAAASSFCWAEMASLASSCWSTCLQCGSSHHVGTYCPSCWQLGNYYECPCSNCYERNGTDCCLRRYRCSQT